MLVYNVGFINSKGKNDATQLDIEKHKDVNDGTIEIINLILSLKEEMNIKEITYIDFVEETDEEE